MTFTSPRIVRFLQNRRSGCNIISEAAAAFAATVAGAARSMLAHQSGDVARAASALRLTADAPEDGAHRRFFQTAKMFADLMVRQNVAGADDHDALYFGTIANYLLFQQLITQACTWQSLLPFAQPHPSRIARKRPAGPGEKDMQPKFESKKRDARRGDGAMLPPSHSDAAKK
jgi:hypothetical protein